MLIPTQGLVGFLGRFPFRSCGAPVGDRVWSERAAESRGMDLLKELRRWGCIRRAAESGAWRPAAAALSAGLTALTFPRFDWGPLAFGSWVPLLLAIEGERPGRAFLLGLYAGTILYAINL